MILSSPNQKIDLIQWIADINLLVSIKKQEKQNSTIDFGNFVEDSLNHKSWVII